MKDLDVIYLSYNRAYYTGMTLPRIIDECKQSKRFNRLFIFDDMSEDGSWELINEMVLPENTYIVRKKYGNSVDQMNEAMEISQAKYFYYIGNDILMPEGIFDFMAEFMDEHPEAISTMIQECAGLPYIKDKEFAEYGFTSSLGIHQSKWFKDKLHAEAKFFGFQPYQMRKMAERGLKALRLHNVANTNLDMSCWNKQDYYYRCKWGRKGLVSNEKSVYKCEHR